MASTLASAAEVAPGSGSGSGSAGRSLRMRKLKPRFFNKTDADAKLMSFLGFWQVNRRRGIGVDAGTVATALASRIFRRR